MQTNKVQAIRMSEVFGIEDYDLSHRKDTIMQYVLKALHALTDIAEHHVWRGVADVHYIFLWNSAALQLCAYKVIGAGNVDHT